MIKRATFYSKVEFCVSWPDGQSPAFIHAHLLLTPLGAVPDPRLSSFKQEELCFHLPKSFLQRFSTMSLSSSFLFLQASQTLGAANASNSPRQTRGERNSRWRWEPFGIRQLSISSSQSLLLLPPAPKLPEHFVPPYPVADPLQGHGGLLRSRLNEKFLF